jgi:hypothetical protein
MESSLRPQELSTWLTMIARTLVIQNFIPGSASSLCPYRAWKHNQSLEAQPKLQPLGRSEPYMKFMGEVTSAQVKGILIAPTKTFNMAHTQKYEIIKHKTAYRSEPSPCNQWLPLGALGFSKKEKMGESQAPK